MVTGLGLSVFGVAIALAVLWWDHLATKRELESLWGRTRDLHNMMGGIEDRRKEFTRKLQKAVTDEGDPGIRPANRFTKARRWNNP
jgi:hypothetical protein